MPWPKLDRDLHLHTRELVVVGGAPGSGKSVWALNVALSLDMPVLYLAQDSAPSVYARIAALTLGVETQWVIDQLRDSKESKQEVLDDLGDAHPNLFIVDRPLTVDGIEARLEALTEVLGTAPPLVIVDNLNDLHVEGFNYTDTGFYAKALPELKSMSKKWNVCMMALHHVTRHGVESHGLGTKKLRMIDMMYAGERDGEHVLGIYHASNKDRMNIQILKQRDGDADPEGGMEVSLLWHPKLGRLGRT